MSASVGNIVERVDKQSRRQTLRVRDSTEQIAFPVSDAARVKRAGNIAQKLLDLGWQVGWEGGQTRLKKEKGGPRGGRKGTTSVGNSD